jgi:hypothetical protein
MPLTTDQLAEAFKSKYPVYKSVPNDKLVTEILKKYPVYASQISRQPGPPAKPFEMGGPGTFAQRFGREFQEDIAGIPRGISQFFKSQHEKYAQDVREGTNPALAAVQAQFESASPMVESLAKSGASTPGLIYQMSQGQDPAKIAADAATFLMTPELAEEGGFAPKQPYKFANAAKTADVLSDIINPEASRAPEFRETLGKHLDAVVSWADRRGKRINSPQALVDALRGTSDELKGHFDARVLNPVQNTSVPISEINGYSGRGATGHRGEGATATLGDLNARLGQISSELDRLYQQGGRTAEEAVRAKDEGSLKAERDSINRVYYRELSRATGIPEQQLRDLRQTFGSLDDAARDAQLGVEKTRAAVNLRGQTPARRLHHEMIQRIDQSMINYRRGRQVESTIGKLGKQQYQPPYPGKSATGRPPRGTPPYRYAQEQAGPLPSGRLQAEEISGAERSRVLEAQRQRRLERLAEQGKRERALKQGQFERERAKARRERGTE